MEEMDDPGVSDATATAMYLKLDFKGKSVTEDIDVSSSHLFRVRCFKPPKARENVLGSQNLSESSPTSQHSGHEVPSRMESFR